jgi:GATA-binding protein
MFARTKERLPHTQRMENLTWRMMALALKKKKDEDEVRVSEKLSNPRYTNEQVQQLSVTSEPLSTADTKEAVKERGRRIGKTNGKVRVVGFDGTNQDGVEDEE